MRNNPGESSGGNAEDLNAERQRRKLAAYFLTNNPDAIRNHDVALAPWQEEEVARKMRCGEISSDSKNRLLKKIASPVDMPEGAEKVFGSLGDRELEILSCMPYDRDGLDEDAMEPQDVERFIKKYNTPMDFKRMENDFLDFLGAQKLDDETDEEYRVAMESFKEKVYGKRYEYYQQMEVMDNEARGYELKKLSLEEKEEILGETDIDGSSWKVGGQEGFLSVENLKALGLSPNIQMSFENAEIAFSPLFKAGVHDAVIGYVKTFGSDEVMARAFYRSNSQGMWRYLPDYISDYDKGRVIFYGKGGNEEKLSLPMVVQDALAKIYDGVDARDIFRR